MTGLRTGQSPRLLSSVWTLPNRMSWPHGSDPHAEPTRFLRSARTVSCVVLKASTRGSGAVFQFWQAAVQAALPVRAMESGAEATPFQTLRETRCVVMFAPAFGVRSLQRRSLTMVLPTGALLIARRSWDGLPGWRPFTPLQYHFRKRTSIPGPGPRNCLKAAAFVVAPFESR